ncbi:sensor domain-containing diguanylate cyclase [Erythrobacter sp. JK5]|uniref:sensor domain-containing diguanylate cyclase n=1 Tax=Erythrobacter sp. JK5 TaxID=2829500 RepID=UPI001BA78C47|nr:sensor domain-containing diguanylate cyclase [Erythrobacter sp. JK5]QUL37579.1 diguanylate cyclase [Erythrobacter sp. JK5]
MNMGLSAEEGMVLHGLLEEAAGDIVIKLDRRGFLIHASTNFGELGYDLSLLLLLPHVSDLAEAHHASALQEYTDRVLGGKAQGGWIEFPVLTCGSSPDCPAHDCRRWYALSLRPIAGEDGAACGAMGLLRSVQRLRALEGELHASVLTDPLTGLSNRHAFCSSLSRHLGAGGGQMVAVFAVDRMRAMFMQYGQRAADEIQWGFAKFLESMIFPEHELAQLDGERFGVVIPDMTPRAARSWADDVLRTFATLTIGASSRSPQVSASAGLARLESTVDWTLRQAELGLVMARAGGGMRVGQCGRLPPGSPGRADHSQQSLGVASAAR